MEQSQSLGQNDEEESQIILFESLDNSNENARMPLKGKFMQFYTILLLKIFWN